MQARYRYGRSDSQVNTNTVASDVRFRQGISERMFLHSESRYEQDGTEGTSRTAGQTLGIGRSLFGDDALTLKLGAGAAARHRSIEGGDDTTRVFLDAFQDLRYTLSERFSIAQDLSVLASAFHEDALTVRLNAALKGAITETVSMSMRYEFQYDGSLDSDEKRDQRIVTALGYTF
jgi:putative salt-induced outer membrane protein YdiY